MNNVVAFRHSVTASVQAPAWPGFRQSNRTLPRAAMPKRRILFAEWRISAADGRLECRWGSEGSECRDEDGSRRSSRRRAA
ncbi:hypothetical protein SAMN05428997_10734 [Bosea sp. CRIB-10]|uniref:hypothetical protein n=1 Tax=Bosea sp. CRIB-10 TaxID=378404 RepID=UPI0008EDADE1|nr:hypothetical protein [Bosea sp. CRIB-10]SFC46371.1 hypothetical protein SAMN05428997_10734 [Bosea sp. CRIB-10]